MMNYEMKKWWIGCGLASLMAVVAVAGLGYLGYVKAHNWNSSRKARIKEQQSLVEAGIAQRRKYLETTLPQKTRDTIPDDFYTYDGLRDWWRMPLVFPYQLVCIDTRDRAGLEKYDPGYPVDDPGRSSSRVLGEITRIATDNMLLAFESSSGQTRSYGIFLYESGKQSECETEAQMWSAAKEAGYSGKNALVSIDALFDAYYNYGKDFVEPSAGGDGKPAPQP